MKSAFPTLLVLPFLLGSCVPQADSQKSLVVAASTSTPLFPANSPQTDVLVIGGTPSGVAAAIAAAREGSNVVLVEPRARLGGDIVYALLNMFDVPMNADGGSRMAVGIFGEWFKQLGIAFDVDEAEALIEDAVKAEPNITLLRESRAEPILEDNRVVGAQIFDLKNTLLGVIRAKTTVDGTNDMDFATKAKAGFYTGREEVNRDRAMQSASLLFEVTNGDWNQLSNYVKGIQTLTVAKKIGQEYASDAAPTTSKEVKSAMLQTPNKPVKLRLGGVDGNYIWERGELIEKYVPRGKDIVVLSINFGRQNGTDLILNTVNIVGVNGLNKADRERAKAEASKEMQTFFPFLQKNVPGLQNASLKRLAPELYIRETRHLKGFYSLTVEDIKAQTQFPDRIALASYPIDLHPYKKGNTNPFGPERYFYTIPLRSLVPRDVDGVFVASRSLSAAYDAAGSARVIPITMGAGEAAGVAASFCAAKDKSPQSLMNDNDSIAMIQNILRENGADVGDEIPTSKRN